MAARLAAHVPVETIPVGPDFAPDMRILLGILRDRCLPAFAYMYARLKRDAGAEIKCL